MQRGIPLFQEFLTCTGRLCNPFPQYLVTALFVLQGYAGREAVRGKDGTASLPAPDLPSSLPSHSLSGSAASSPILPLPLLFPRYCQGQ